MEYSHALAAVGTVTVGLQQGLDDIINTFRGKPKRRVSQLGPEARRKLWGEDTVSSYSILHLDDLPRPVVKL